jgi:hypothetical protein
LRRVSSMMIGENSIRYIQQNMQRAARLQEQLAAEKTILRPSDDPGQVSRVMAVNSTIDRNQQYVRNIDDGLAYLNQADTASAPSVKYCVTSKRKHCRAPTILWAATTGTPSPSKLINRSTPWWTWATVPWAENTSLPEEKRPAALLPGSRYRLCLLPGGYPACFQRDCIRFQL